MDPMEELKMYPRWAQFLPHLLMMEGRGDKVGPTPTGLAGMTKGTYAKLRNKLPGRDLPEVPDSYWEEGKPDKSIDPHILRASNLYTNEIYSDYMNPKSKSYLEGFDALPASAQDYILSSAYNLGKDFHVDTPKKRRMPKFKAAVKSGDTYEATRQLLDTAVVGDFSSLGVAVRRGTNFNAAADSEGTPRISHIVAADDGIKYFGEPIDGKENLIMDIPKPLHPSNKPRTVRF